MTVPGESSLGADRVRQQVHRLLGDLERFGVSAHAPQYIRSDPIAGLDVDAITQTRARLIAFLRNDPRLKNMSALGETELRSLQVELVRFCVEGRLQNYLSHVEVPHPVYNFLASFDENADGPWDRLPIEPEGVTPVAFELMGIPVRFPLGVPASGLTANCRWIEYFSLRGFNILTYKTVRSVEVRPHAYPHWVFIEDLDPWTDSAPHVVHGSLDTWPKTFDHFSTANSFGVPSPPPLVWQRDVEASLAILQDGQLLIVSVMGTGDGDDQRHDFVKVSQLAEQAGAPVVELNLSCPNTLKKDSQHMDRPICMDPHATGDIVRAVRDRLDTGTRLVAKLGYLDHETLTRVIEEISDSVDAVSAINTVQARIRRPFKSSPVPPDDDLDTPFMGTAADPNRPRLEAGVSGAVIRNLGLDMIQRLDALRSSIGPFDLIGIGGVMTVDDVDAYFSAGANAVQVATGACLNPQLPSQAAQRYVTPGRVEPAAERPLDTNRLATHNGERMSFTADVIPEPRFYKYRESVVDAVGQQSETGPDADEASTGALLLRRWARSMGRIAVGEGVATEVMLGLLDAGVRFDDFVEAVVMHGDLPILEEYDPASSADLRLVEGPDGWSVEPTTPRPAAG